MWTDFDAPSHTTLAETAAARERARSKKRRKQPPRSKRKSTGAPCVTSNKLTLKNPASSTGSTQRGASALQTDPVTLNLETFRDELPEAPKTSILQVAPIPIAHGIPSQMYSSCIEQCKNLEIDDPAVSLADAALVSCVDNRGLPTATAMPSAIVDTEQRSTKTLLRLRAHKQVRLVVMGSIAVGSALWLLTPVHRLEIEPLITADQSPVSVRMWTDPTPLKQVQIVEGAPVTAKMKPVAIVATTGLPAVASALPEVGVEVDRPTDHRLVEPNSIRVVSAPQDVVQSIFVSSIPLPPRRPVSLLVRHMPAVHPIASTAKISVPASTEPPSNQAEPSESYASFSARKHEIGTHKLAWGVARLHEDANSSSGRGAVWDFVPSEP